MTVSSGSRVLLDTIILAPLTTYCIVGNITARALEKTGVVNLVARIGLDSGGNSSLVAANTSDQITEASTGLTCTYSTGKLPVPIYLTCSSGSNVNVTVNQYFCFTI
jgi:hypothetical protein